MITQTIYVAVDKVLPPVRLKMRQSDSGRIVAAHVYCADTPFSLTGLLVEFRAKKPDGTTIARIEGISTLENVATVQLTANTLAAAGIIKCELVIAKSNGQAVGTAIWEIEATAAAVPESELQSQDDYQSIIAYAATTKAYKDEAGQYAADASTSEAMSIQGAARAEAALNEIKTYSANAPYPGDNGNWWAWNGSKYVDTGKSWQAAGGYMEAAAYDQGNEVKTAGGIKAYVQKFYDGIKDAFVALATPTGSGKIFYGATAPTGFLLCQGQAVSRTTYAKLFAVLGTTYGTGNGTTTFAVPDMRGRVPVGCDANLGLGQKVGEPLTRLTVPEMPSHGHNDVGGGYWRYTSGATSNLASGGGMRGTATTSVASEGGNQPHNTMQPSIGVNYIIKT